jgi:DNA-binding MarR family transcriptional regulator
LADASQKAPNLGTDRGHKVSQKTPRLFGSDLQESHALVSQMKVALGAVTKVVRKLESEGLVTLETYRSVKLTDERRRIAIGVLRKEKIHRVLIQQWNM